MPIANTDLPKAATGIEGLDDITGGGLPRNRPTLLCGGTGTGKTLIAMEFLVHGAALYDEAGIFITFEENVNELRANVASFGFDVEGLIAKKKLEIDHVSLERGEISGAYNLDGLFIRLDLALKNIHAKRVVLDSVDMLFAALPNPALIREEIHRLLRWLKERNMTVVVTGESGDNKLTRTGVEEFVADCVITLDNRVTRQATNRLLRIVKYRGSAHGTNEYPFLIGPEGISVLPVTTLALDFAISDERVSTGITRLDTMLDGKGYYRGSTIMVSGPPGSGKSSLAAAFAVAACARGERCLYFLLEEPANQLVRNMRSIGIDLQPWQDNGLLQFEVTRPTLYGLEMHLARFHRAVVAFKPSVVIFDPISTLHSIENPIALKLMLLRLANYLKSLQITTHFVSLTSQGEPIPSSETGISSMIDSWILLRDVESNGERNRVVLVLKSRGMPHSNQSREFTLSQNGIELIDVYVGASGILTGSARIVQEAQEKSIAQALQTETEHRTMALESQRKLKDARIAAIEAAFTAQKIQEELQKNIDQKKQLFQQKTIQRLSKQRQADAAKPAVSDEDGSSS